MRKVVCIALACLLSSAALPGEKAPKVGDPAPLFRLPAAGSGMVIDLHDVVGKKPIVLFFGSYT